jgi:hypothetical protein
VFRLFERVRLRCDVYEETRGNLIEAKCRTDREYVRMAVGQLFDYSFLARREFGRLRLAILLPSKPSEATTDWLKPLGISLIWKEKSGFKDNANGQFT